MFLVVGALALVVTDVAGVLDGVCAARSALALAALIEALLVRTCVLARVCQTLHRRRLDRFLKRFVHKRTRNSSYVTMSSCTVVPCVCGPFPSIIAAFSFLLISSP